jgi:hypothetical protein
MERTIAAWMLLPEIRSPAAFAARRNIAGFQETEREAESLNVEMEVFFVTRLNVQSRHGHFQTKCWPATT